MKRVREYGLDQYKRWIDKKVYVIVERDKRKMPKSFEKKDLRKMPDCKDVDEMKRKRKVLMSDRVDRLICY